MKMKPTTPGRAVRWRAKSKISKQTRRARLVYPGRSSLPGTVSLNLSRIIQQSSTNTLTGPDIETSFGAQIVTVSSSIAPAKPTDNEWSFEKFRSRAAEGWSLIKEYFSVRGLLGFSTTRVAPARDSADDERVDMAYANDKISALNAFVTLYMMSHALDFRQGESTPKFIRYSILLMGLLILNALILLREGLFPLLVNDLKYLPQPYNYLLTLGITLLYCGYYIIFGFSLVIIILRNSHNLREVLQRQGDPLLFNTLIITQFNHEDVMPCQPAWLFYIVKTILILLNYLIMLFASVPHGLVMVNVFVINTAERDLDIKMKKELMGYHEFVRLAKGSKSAAKRIGLQRIYRNLGPQMMRYAQFIVSYEKLFGGIPYKVNEANKWIAVFWAMTLFMGPSQTIETHPSDQIHKVIWAVLVTLKPNFVSALIRVIVYVVNVMYIFCSSGCLHTRKETVLFDLRQLHEEADQAREDEGLQPDYAHWNAYNIFQLEAQDVKFTYRENMEYDGTLSSVSRENVFTLIGSTLCFLSLRVVFRAEHTAIVAANVTAAIVTGNLTMNMTEICRAASNSSSLLIPGVTFIMESLTGGISSLFNSSNYGPPVITHLLNSTLTQN